MSLMLNNGLSGLLAAQRALQVTSNNVTNAGVDGYVRQRVLLAENPTQPGGAGLSIGTGVKINSIERVYDKFLAQELHSSETSEGRARSFNALATRLDGLLGNPDLSISADIQRFFDQAQTLTENATSQVNRQQLLQQGESLVTRFKQLDSQLNSFNNEVDARLGEAVGTINGIAQSLATVNDRIAASAGSVPNDLLTEQGRLLSQLANEIDFTVVEKGNGTADVLIGSGQPLVLGVTARQLTLTQNEFNGSIQELAIADSSGAQIISDLVSGGTVAGLLSFRDQALNATQRDLGLLALGLTEVFNNQHGLGLDLNGDLGTDFFDATGPAVSASNGNTGTATAAATIVDPAALTGRNYVLQDAGGAWLLFDEATGATIPTTGTGTAVDPIVAEGLEIVVTGASALGDRYLVSSVSGAPAAMSVLLNDPSKIAAASPVSVIRSLQNLSDAESSPAVATDINDANLLQPVDIVFDDATTYRIFDGGTDLTGPLAYTSGADINFNGWTLQISGATQTGDRFSITSTGANSGDNGNALALTDISTLKVFGNGQRSLGDLSANIVSQVGSAAARSSEELAVQSSLRQQIQLEVESVSGVNLDEEAVNMLRYQEAYMAASRIISVANDLFNTLLNVVSR